MTSGALALATLGFWHRTFDNRKADPIALGIPCNDAGEGPLCDAARDLRWIRHGLAQSASAISRLPPPAVRGAIDPGVDQDNIGTTICHPGYSRSVRPSYSVTGPLKRRMMNAQHPGEPMANYELDHLIPISLGGAPLDPRDLWLQPRRGRANANDKNALAFVLWRLVCEHRMPLVVAQLAISHNWIEAYQTYATPANLARYHFRHGAERETKF